MFFIKLEMTILSMLLKYLYIVFLNMNVKLVLNSLHFASVILGHKEDVSGVHT